MASPAHSKPPCWAASEWLRVLLREPPILQSIKQLVQDSHGAQRQLTRIYDEFFFAFYVLGTFVDI